MNIIFNNLSYPNTWILMDSFVGNDSKVMRVRLDFDREHDFTIKHIMAQIVGEKFNFDEDPNTTYQVSEAQEGKSVAHPFVITIRFEKCVAKPYEAPAIEEEGELKTFNVEVFIKYSGQVKAHTIEDARAICKEIDPTDVEDILLEHSAYMDTELDTFKVYHE